MYFQSTSESLSRGKITFLLSPLERLYPAHKIRHWKKTESIPPFLMPGWHLRMGLGQGRIWGEMVAPSWHASGCQWRQKPHQPTVPSGKTGDNLNLQLPSMERRDVPSAQMGKTSLCSSWQQRSCSSKGQGRGARARRSPGLQSGASGLFG